MKLNKFFGIVIVLQISLSPLNLSYSQFSKLAYDRQYITLGGQGRSIFSGGDPNITDWNRKVAQGQGSYQSLTGPFQYSLIQMYLATGDIDYLRDFVEVSENIQNYRDDKMQSNQGDPFTNSGCSFNGISPKRPNEAIWSIYLKSAYYNDNNCVWYASTIYSGEIIFPMAYFVYLVNIERTFLQSESCNSSVANDLGEYADWLYERIKETIAVHENAPPSLYQSHLWDYWSDGKVDCNDNIGPPGYYRPTDQGDELDDSVDDYVRVDLNFEAAMGCAFVMMHEITNDPVEKADLIYKIRSIKNNWDNLTDFTTVNGTYYTWNHGYWEHIQASQNCEGSLVHNLNGEGKTEDLSHGGDDVRFAVLCNRFGLTDVNSNLLFTSSDMEKFVNTFTRSTYYHPRRFYNGIDGSNTSCPIKNVCYNVSGTGCSCNEFYYSLHITDWLLLSDRVPNSYSDYIGRDLYQMSLEYAAFEMIYGATGSIHPRWHGDPNSSTWPCNFSYNSLYAKRGPDHSFMDIMTLNVNPGSGSNWVGVEGGDLIGNDGVDEICMLRNSSINSKLLIYKLIYEEDSYGSFEVPVIDYVCGIDPGNQDFVDIAVGNFVSDPPGDKKDEIVVFSNALGHIDLYQYQSDCLQLVATDGTPSTSSNWKGVASGNLDHNSTNGDEFVGVRNLDGKFFMFRYDGNNIVGITSWYSSIQYPDWAGLTAGDINGDGKTDIIAVENNGSIFEAYTYDPVSGTVSIIATRSVDSHLSQWTDITCGDYNNDGTDDIIAHRSLDGDVYLLVYNTSSQMLSQVGEEYFTSGQQMDVFGSGRFDPNSEDGTDQIVALRNLNGDILMYNVREDYPYSTTDEWSEEQEYIPADRKGKIGFEETLNTHEEFEFNIFPNPNGGTFTVEVERPGILKLLNLNGQLIYLVDIENLEQISIPDIKPGMYLVEFTSNTGHLIRNKIVVK